MGRGRGHGSRLSSTQTPRGRAAAGGGALTSAAGQVPRSPLKLAVVADFAAELRAGEADELVDAICDAPRVHGTTQRERLRAHGAAAASIGTPSVVRRGQTELRLDAEHTVSLTHSLTEDDTGVAASLDAVLSRGVHRLGVFSGSAHRGFSADNDAMLVAADVVRDLGRQLETR